MSKKMLFIMNPVAGVKKPNKCLTEILTLFSNEDYEIQVQMTSPVLNGAHLVEKYGKDKNLVICVGGDGTFNETVSGLLNNKLFPNVGYIPSGSTNDFANGLGISQNPMQAAKDIISGKPRKIDAGSFNGRLFIYTASFGIFTKASYSTPRDMKNTLGYLAYLLEGSKEIFDAPSYHIRAKSKNHSIEGDYIFGTICNAKRIGGGLVKFSENSVDINDGKLEVLFVKYPKNPAEMMQIVFDAQSGKYDSPMFDFFSAEEIIITTDDKISWSLDGEYQKGCEKIRISNIKNAFSLILNDKKDKTNNEK